MGGEEKKKKRKFRLANRREKKEAFLWSIWLAKSGKERVETEGEEWEAGFPVCFSLWLPL